MSSPEEMIANPNALNEIRIASAEQYMLQKGVEMLTPHAAIGWKQEAHERHPERNEDTVYSGVTADAKFTVAAVFDGVGGHARGDEASKAARQTLHEIVGYESFEDDTLDKLSGVFDRMAEAVATDTERGSTGSVVLVGELDENGEADAYIASVGDSPVFLVRRDGQVAKLTVDDTFEQQMLTDYAKDRHWALERYKYRFPSMKTDEEFMQIARNWSHEITNGFGAGLYEGASTLRKIRIREGDFLVVVSDGITGDKPEQKLPGESNEMAIAQIMCENRQETPAQKAERLVKLAGSREGGRQPKIDDRSAVVVEVKRNGSDKLANQSPKKPSYAERAGVEDGNFRVVRDGQVEDMGWSLVKIQKFRPNAESTLTYYILEKQLEENGSVDRIFVSQDEFNEWQQGMAQDAFKKTADEHARLLAEQQADLVKAREILTNAPAGEQLHRSNALPAVMPEGDNWWNDERRRISDSEFYLGQPVIVPRGKPEENRYGHARIRRAQFNDETGKKGILVEFSAIDQKTGEQKRYTKHIAMDVLSAVQNSYARGEITPTE